MIWATAQKTYLRTCAPSEDSDQSAHSRSLIKVFTGRILDSQGCIVSLCGQWGMKRLIFTGRILGNKGCMVAMWTTRVDQADLSIRWAHISEDTFTQVVANWEYRRISWQYRRISIQGSNMAFHALMFARSRGRCWKPRPEGGFQHLPRDLANVNALKNHVRSLLLHKKLKTIATFRVISSTILFRLFTDVSRTQFPRNMFILGPGSTYLVTAAKLWPRYEQIESCVAVHLQRVNCLVNTRLFVGY